MARPIRRAPPVTSAAPGRGSVNPAEFEEVEGGDHGDETEDDVEGQHGKLLFWGRNTGAGPRVQAADVAPAPHLSDKTAMTDLPAPDFPVTVFHNPRCSKSRQTVELIRARGIEPELVLYLQTGWTEARLRGLIDRMGISPGALLRIGEAEAATLAPDAPDAALIAAMIAHPILVERPIVETPLGVALGRPLEAVLAILPGRAS